MRIWEQLSRRAKAITVVCVMVTSMGGALAVIAPYTPTYARAEEVDRLEQSVVRLTNMTIQQAINGKTAEIRTIKSIHNYRVPPAVQPQIEMLEADIEVLEESKISEKE